MVEVLLSATFANATYRSSYMLRNVQRTDTNEYIGVADDKGRVRVRTKPCNFKPANDQTAVVDVFVTPAYSEAYIRFRGAKILKDVNAEPVCEVVKVTSGLSQSNHY